MLEKKNKMGQYSPCLLWRNFPGAGLGDLQQVYVERDLRRRKNGFRVFTLLCRSSWVNSPHVGKATS